MPLTPNFPTNYDAAARRLDGKRSVRLPGTATTLESRDNGRIAIRYHYTDIVTFCDSGATILNSGGYHTVTTKRKMNAALPANGGIRQEDFAWYYTRGGAVVAAFQDGTIIDSVHGDIVSQPAGVWARSEVSA